MIILEGVDRTGKTSIGLYLRNHCGYSYRHTTRPPIPCYRYLMTQLADSHPWMVWDRLHYGELAYGLVYRSQVDLSPHKWRLIELACLSRGATVLHMTDELESIKSRWGAEEMWPGWGIEALLKQYDALARGESFPRSRLPCATFALPELLAGDEPTPLLQEVVAQARAQEHRYTLMPPPSLFLGSIDAEFMVLAEAPPPSAPPKDKTGSDPDLPLSRGPAAEWFWRAADEVGLHWWRGCFTNAATFDSSTSHWWWFRALRHHMKQLRLVLCLGERAEQFVRQQQQDGWRVQAVRAWHPSYARQFHHKEYPEWKDSVALALASWCEDARLSLDSAGYPDGHEVIAEEPRRPGSGPVSPRVQEPLAPDEKAVTCRACRGRGFTYEDGHPACDACGGKGYAIRTAS